MSFFSARQNNKYRPSLAGLMNLAEVNYMLVLRLLADKEEAGTFRKFFVADLLAFKIHVQEVTKYTSLITIRQEVSYHSESLDKIMCPSMVLRLYHDARMVEVISSQNIRQVKPRYDYPNAQMHQPDEKQQVLLFLKEWLQLCLQQGQVNVDFFAS